MAFVAACLVVFWTQTVGLVRAAYISSRRNADTAARRAGNPGVLHSGGNELTSLSTTKGSYVETIIFQNVYLGGSSYQIYSNHDAVWLSDLIWASPEVIGPGLGRHIHTFAGRIIQVGDDVLNSEPNALTTPPPIRPVTVTYTATGGEFNIFRADEYGVVGQITSSFTITGAPDEIHEALSNTLFIPRPNFAGDAIVTATSSDSMITVENGMVVSITPTSPISRSLTIPVTPYPDDLYPGQYKDSVKSLKSILDLEPSPTSELAAGYARMLSAANAANALEADDDVRGGIKWQTLKRLERNKVTDGPEETNVWGTFYEVETKAGNKIILFEADALNAQPAKTRANKEYINGDIRYNCHGLTFGLSNVEVGGNPYKFSIVQSSDVKTLLTDSYQKLTPDDALKQAGILAFVFYDKNGQAIHSCKTTNPLLVVKDGKLVEKECRVFTKNGYNKLDGTGLATLASLKKVYPDTVEIRIYALKP
jgi:hypothetical protein